MNAVMKRRAFVVTGLIVVVFIVVLAVVAGQAGFRTLSIAEALEPGAADTRVQVTGKVVDDSYSFTGDTLSFLIYDPEDDPSKQLKVRYEGGASATFGNQVTAICTGRIDASGILECSELVTKCPSKYENATDALSVAQLAGYGGSVDGKPLKVTGIVQQGSLGSVNAAVRLVLADEATGAELPVIYGGALSNEIAEGSVLVVTGARTTSGSFEATDVALRGE